MKIHTTLFYRLIALILAVGTLFGALSGCSEPEAEQLSNDTLEVTDALGRTLSIPKNPARVAALLGSFADVWCLAGGTLCAAAEDAWEDFSLELPGAVNLGGAHSPNLELLVASDPDLVLASASSASNVNLLQSLEAMGIPVIYFEVDCFEEYLSMLDVCTALTGRCDLYEQNGLALQAEIEAIKVKYANQNIPTEQRKILLLRASSGSVKAKGGSGTVLGEMLRDIGCINIADGNDTLLENLSIESILRENPYHIFAVTMGSDTVAATDALYRLLEENPSWSSLAAVRENRVHVMDKKLFNLKPNARWAEAYGVLYETLTQIPE